MWWYFIMIHSFCYKKRPDRRKLCLKSSVGVTATCYIVTGMLRSPDVSQWGWQLHVTLLQVSDERGEPLQGVLMSLSGGDSYMLHCYRYLMSVVSRYKESWCLSVGVTATCYIVTGIWWAWWAVTGSPDVSQWEWWNPWQVTVQTGGIFYFPWHRHNWF